MNYAKYRIFMMLFIVLVTIIPSIGFVSKANAKQDSYTQLSVTPDEIYANIKTRFTDPTNGGYFESLTKDNQVQSFKKYCSDYIYAIDTIIRFIKYENNISYENDITGYLNLLNNFKTGNGGYVALKNVDWSDAGAAIDSVSMAALLGMYANLYNVTSNSSYLSSAYEIYNFFQHHFYDAVHGGYYYQLDPTTLANTFTPRDTGTYGNIAQAFLDLYKQTNNNSVLLSGFYLLNETIDNAFDTSYNYFIPYLSQNTNQPLSSYKNFVLSQQANLAEALLSYTSIDQLTNLVGNYKTRFYSVANKIYTNIITNLLNINDVYVSYDVQTNSKNFLIDVAVQTQFHDFLLLRKQYVPNNDFIDTQILNNSSSILSGFLSNSLLFIRSNDNQITSPWVNYAVLKTILDLKHNNIYAELYHQSSNEAVSSTSTSTSTGITINGDSISAILAIVIITLIVGFIAYRTNKNSPDRFSYEEKLLNTNTVFINEDDQKKDLINNPDQTNSKVCLNCGNETLAGDVFCHNCGSRI